MQLENDNQLYSIIPFMLIPFALLHNFQDDWHLHFYEIPGFYTRKLIT